MDTKQGKEDGMNWETGTDIYTLLCVTYIAAAAAAKLLQSCPTLCDPIDGSPPGFPILGILQARMLEWVAISFSNIDSQWEADKQHRDLNSVFCDDLDVWEETQEGGDMHVNTADSLAQQKHTAKLLYPN